MLNHIVFENYSLEKNYKCSPLTVSSNFTPLMVIVMNTNQYPELNQYIKNYKKIINEVNKEGWTALILACRNVKTKSSIETVKLLIHYGADVNITISNEYEHLDKWTALILSCRNSNKESSDDVVKILLKNNANINAITKDGHTALSYACRCANDSTIKTVELLLHYGADITINTVLDTTHTIAKLLLTYHNIYTLNQLLLTKFNYKEDVIEEITNQYKIEKIKILNYERTLKHIPEQDAKVRFKPGNMGHKICKFDFDGIVTNELLYYLSATPDNIHQKAEQFLSINN